MNKGLPARIIKKYGVTKKAWAVFRGKKSESRPKRVKTKTNKTRGISMAKKKSRISRGSLIRSVEKVAIGGALVAPAVIDLTAGKSLHDGLVDVLWHYTGYNANSKRWDGIGPMKMGYTPFLAVSLGAIGYHKIRGLIRSA